MAFDVTLIDVETIKQNIYFSLLLYRNKQNGVVIGGWCLDIESIARVSIFFKLCTFVYSVNMHVQIFVYKLVYIIQILVLYLFSILIYIVNILVFHNICSSVCIYLFSIKFVQVFLYIFVSLHVYSSVGQRQSLVNNQPRKRGNMEERLINKGVELTM